MKVWMGFLLLFFLIGGRELHRGRSMRVLVLLGLCVVTALMMRSNSFA